MAETAEAKITKYPGLRSVIARHASTLSAQLQAHHMNIFPPHARKGIRTFSPAETAKLLGVAEGYLRTVASEMPDFNVAQGAGGRRMYSVDDIAALRKHLEQGSRASGRYLPHRRDGEDLQVIAVMNFKGGSGKTTTSAHLAQYLALRGFRVLAIDLDPQASLSALFGNQPEIHVGPNETLYGAIRYDEEQRHMSEVVRSTYIPDLHLVPGNLELMEFEHDTPRALMTRQAGDTLFFARVQAAIAQVEENYDVVVIDCPPQLGFLTLSALTAATSVLITVHPQMLDVMSMNQFLSMTSDLLEEISASGAEDRHKWMRYLITRFEPTDGPQNQMVAFLRSMFAENVMINPMLKSTAISDAGLTNQTLFEVDRGQFTRTTYDRALESMNNVNGEIEALIKKAWGRAA
ncbi:plasmid partitioning protein RepA [Rhizobium calliandrae]|uniref:Plasmid partitioning protein RepA n=1 Tax=Rhizobium calliandrae TaxID=1312182 RepID=A0ABT7KC23_9HYPH|nr:plasmid partitioning protein RepA [Rhizobium calliandrae]MDL2406161.1 plasmid partitioning protein RepA [Rhizobium calliandrae]